MRAGVSVVRCRRKAERGNVCKLSKETTQSDGTSSFGAVSASSDTTPRRVRVIAATTTLSIRSATGSRVSTSTGRSPPAGVAANQTSPRCMISPISPGSPVRPVFGRTPIIGVVERSLVARERLFIERVGLNRDGQPGKMGRQRLAQELRALYAEFFCPSIGRRQVILFHTEADHHCHCHTLTIDCHTASRVEHAAIRKVRRAVPVTRGREPPERGS